jgi:hypothetical protein
VQLVALVELHVKVALPPLAILVGLALKLTVGANGGVDVIVIVTLCVAKPPVPVHVRVNFVVADNRPDDCVPAVPFEPDQPSLAVQSVALAEVHVKVDAVPIATLRGLAVRDNEGAGTGELTVTDAVWLLVPPSPVHVRVKLLLAVRGALVSVPEVGRAPLHAPEALQLVALVELQVKFVTPPLSTTVGLALMLTVGAGVVTASCTT